VSLRIDNSILERIDAFVSHTGITRTDHILRWPPGYYDGKAADAILGSVELARD
jgi:hypothetical protein